MRTLILALVTLSSFAFAQTQQPAAKQPPKPQQVDFSEVQIGGSTVSPIETYVPARTPPKFGSFIKVRSSFNDKLAASVYDL